MRKGFRCTYTMMIMLFDYHQNVIVQSFSDLTEL